MKTRALRYVLFLAMCCALHFVAHGQSQPVLDRQVLQLSGRVVAADSLSGLEGIAVFVAGTTRSTYTRKSGYFSMPVVAGDTVLFGALGYARQQLIIPTDPQRNSTTVVIVLEEQATPLPTVDVMPWATEYDLKQAVLRTKLPPDSSELVTPLPPQEEYKSVSEMPDMGADGNFKYGQKILQEKRESRYKFKDVIKIFSLPIKYY